MRNKHLTTVWHSTIVYRVTRLICGRKSGRGGRCTTQRVRLHTEDTEDISLGQFRALSEFRYQIRKFQHFSEKAARALGLEPQQHQLLLAIKGFDGKTHGPTIGYLAERLQVRHHSAVELVDRLETRGMVHRQTGEHDRRQVIVALSDAGEQILKDLATEHIAEIQQIGPGLVRALQQVLAGESYAGVGALENT